MTLKTTSIFSSSLAQIGAGLVIVIGATATATTWVNGRLAAIEAGQAKIMANQVRVETLLDKNVVTWDQARIFRADIQRDNPGLKVPELAQYRTP